LHCEPLEDRTVPGFLPPVTSPGDFSSVGDFNADGKADVVVTEGVNVSVRLGNGDGTFQPSGPAQVGGNVPQAVADFDGDGKLDVLGGSVGSATLRLLRGNGDGTLQAPVVSGAIGKLLSFQVADMNNDGRPDVVARSYQFSFGHGSVHNWLSILLAQTNGSFIETQSILVGHTDHGNIKILAPSSVHAADFDGNGRQDLMTIASSTSNKAYPSRFLLGNGDGTVTIGPNVNQFVAVDVTVADLNRDGRADVIRTSANGPASNVFLGQGNGQFTRTQRVPVAGNLVVADVNQDLRPDLVSVNPGNGTVRVLLGKGNGKFQPAQDFATDLMPAVIASGDFDGDGWLDVIAAGGGALSVLINARAW
jgi:hypothetical protein